MNSVNIRRLIVAAAITLTTWMSLALAQTPFTNLVIFGSPADVRARIAGGADVNARVDPDGVPLLSLGVWGNPHLEVVELLISNGADLDAVDNFGKTPLMYAAEKNDTTDRLELLLRFGADPTVVDDEGRSALDYLADNEELSGSNARQLLEDAVANLQVASAASGGAAAGAPESITLIDGTHLVGELSAEHLLFTTQYGEFEFELSEILIFEGGSIELTDGTKFIGEFSGGTWNVVTSRLQFEVLAEEVVGFVRTATATASTTGAVASTDIPTEAEARAAYEEELNRRLGGVARLQSFQKTDGARTALPGMELYTVYFKATVAFPQGWNADCSPNRPTTRRDCIVVLSGAQGVGSRLGLGSHPYRDPGTIEEVEWEIMLQRRESGWR